MHIRKLLASLSLLVLTGTCAALAANVPHVDAHIDPVNSYWANHVDYGFPLHYAKVADGQGRQWEIAYGDLFRGNAANKTKAPVLVLLHGRAMNSGYWGQLMEAPLAAGWRVLAIDWSNSGKSLPRNLDMPVNRSLDDARQIIFNLVVKQLGIRKASYLGHSLGGQVAAGYALTFPDNVDRLVLYAPSGIESMPPLFIKGVRIDDPALAKTPEAFLPAWTAAKEIFSMGSTQHEVEQSFYETKRPNAMPYLQKGGDLATFIVASRAGVLRGNLRERERFLQNYVWESIASINELRQEDADSLSNRIAKLKVPTMVAFGVKESAFPMPGSGNTSLVSDVVHPFYRNVRVRKSPVEIKLYADAGHFIHTDLPEQFSRDVLHFLQNGKADAPVYAGDREKYLPPVRAPLAALPDDVMAFKLRFEKAYVKQDLAAVRALFHPDFKNDGKTLEPTMSFVESFLPMMTRQELVVFGVEQAGDQIVLDVEARNNFGKFPYLFKLKKTNGEWRRYGNQQ